MFSSLILILIRIRALLPKVQIGQQRMIEPVVYLIVVDNCAQARALLGACGCERRQPFAEHRVVVQIEYYEVHVRALVENEILVQVQVWSANGSSCSGGVRVRVRAGTGTKRADASERAVRRGRGGSGRARLEVLAQELEEPGVQRDDSREELRIAEEAVRREHVEQHEQVGGELVVAEVRAHADRVVGRVHEQRNALHEAAGELRVHELQKRHNALAVVLVAGAHVLLAHRVHERKTRQVEMEERLQT